MITWINIKNSKKLCRDILGLLLLSISFFLVSCTAGTKQTSSEEPKTVFVYSKAFAKQFGLDESKAIELDPGIYAIALVVKKTYSMIFPMNHPFIRRYHLDKGKDTNIDSMIHNHFEVFPILFPKERKPLFTKYNCYFNIYVDNNLTKNIAMPEGENAFSDNHSSSITDLQSEIPTAWGNNVLSKPTPANFKYSPFANKNNQLTTEEVKRNLSMAILSKTEEDFTRKDHKEFYIIPYSSYKKRILPGIDFISVGGKFGFIDILKVSGSRNAILWLRKNSGKNLNNFYPIKIPAQITQSNSLKNIAIKNEKAYQDKISWIFG